MLGFFGQFIGIQVFSFSTNRRSQRTKSVGSLRSLESRNALVKSILPDEHVSFGIGI
jgi:hypothetical protein